MAASTFFDPSTPILVQGINGRVGSNHSRNMRAYGTNIVAGVSSRGDEVDGIPVYRSTREAAAASGAKAAVAVVPAAAVLPTILDSLDAGIELIVTLAEGMPVHDAVRARAAVKAAGARWVGASTPGFAIPGKAKLGFLPSASLAPGDIGVMAKSGTLSYEVCHRLVQAGFGQSLWIGVGGDVVKGMRFSEVLPYFELDRGTRTLVIIGEIGGNEEEELGDTIKARAFGKPSYALIAGASAREGVTMGHAGALIHGNVGTVATKTSALASAGVQVFTRIADLIAAIELDRASA